MSIHTHTVLPHEITYASFYSTWWETMGGRKRKADATVDDNVHGCVGAGKVPVACHSCHHPRTLRMELLNVFGIKQNFQGKLFGLRPIVDRGCGTKLLKKKQRTHVDVAGCAQEVCLYTPIPFCHMRSHTRLSIRLGGKHCPQLIRLQSCHVWCVRSKSNHDISTDIESYHDTAARTVTHIAPQGGKA